MSLPERQNYFTGRPFNSLSDYNIENEYISTKRKLQSLLDNDEFQSFLKDDMYEEIFYAAKSISCQYYGEEQFISKNRNGDEFLNIFTLNIRSLPKHGGELYVYLESLNTNFDVIILTEIGARNLSVVQKLLPNFTVFYSPPVDSNWVV